MKSLGLFLCVALCSLTQAQFFDPELDDKTYLDRIEVQINMEVERAAVELLAQTKVAEKITKSYITVKIKDNVFKALRTLAENEVVQAGSGLARQSLWHERQEEAESSGSGGDEKASGGEAASGSDAGGGGEAASGGGEAGGTAEEEDAAEASTTPLNGLSTAVKINQNVFSFLGETIKIIFKGLGGKSFPREATSAYTTTSDELVQAIPGLMRKPYAEQLVGILSLLSKDGEGIGLVNSNASQSPVQATEEKVAVRDAPLSFLFGKRQRPSTSQNGKANTNVARKNAIPKPMFTTYVEKIKKTQPWLLPDLYRGIPEANRLLHSINSVIDGIKSEVGAAVF